MQRKLNLPDAQKGNFVDALDSKLHFIGPTRPSKRHRVNNNLTGVRDFCLLARRTDKLEKLMKLDLSSRGRLRIRKKSYAKVS